MLDESLSVDCRRGSATAGKRDIAEIWAEFCNFDPEHSIWGTEPNETPPEVEIQRVVFAPKKSQIDDGKGKKRKKSKTTKDATTAGRERNKSCIVM